MLKPTLWFLRLSLTVHTACVVAQPVLAGRYLDGDYDAIGAHSLNGSVLPASGMVVGVAALAYWIAGGAGWPLLTYAALWLAEGFQIGMGYARVLVIHIPLGVTIVLVAVWLTIWIWLPRAARPRRGYRRRARESTRAQLDRASAEPAAFPGTAAAAAPRPPHSPAAAPGRPIGLGRSAGRREEQS